MAPIQQNWVAATLSGLVLDVTKPFSFTYDVMVVSYPGTAGVGDVRMIAHGATRVNAHTFSNDAAREDVFTTVISNIVWVQNDPCYALWGSRPFIEIEKLFPVSLTEMYEV